ncbi:hypothetical protein BJ508DRAFT_300332 [Ascobolus immersus RN42]|uniref:Uncharacterized protein n=1 Tax=Ascobolus immersus RN42 TaxID=1160509 RepID=A0A3N4IQG0_ASCIM|nr:hypothetical protein BJ508DRAFT_300332 [Ascobolus immersus RN42]
MPAVRSTRRPAPVSIESATAAFKSISLSGNPTELRPKRPRPDAEPEEDTADMKLGCELKAGIPVIDLTSTPDPPSVPKVRVRPAPLRKSKFCSDYSFKPLLGSFIPKRSRYCPGYEPASASTAAYTPYPGYPKPQQNPLPSGDGSHLGNHYPRVPPHPSAVPVYTYYQPSMRVAPYQLHSLYSRSAIAYEAHPTLTPAEYEAKYNAYWGTSVDPLAPRRRESDLERKRRPQIVRRKAEVREKDECQAPRSDLGRGEPFVILEEIEEAEDQEAEEGGDELMDEDTDGMAETEDEMWAAGLMSRLISPLEAYYALDLTLDLFEGPLGWYMRASFRRISIYPYVFMWVFRRLVCKRVLI